MQSIRKEGDAHIPKGFFSTTTSLNIVLEEKAGIYDISDFIKMNGEKLPNPKRNA
jgi:hypothetical protein